MSLLERVLTDQIKNLAWEFLGHCAKHSPPNRNINSLICLVTCHHATSHGYPQSPVLPERFDENYEDSNQI